MDFVFFSLRFAWFFLKRFAPVFKLEDVNCLVLKQRLERGQTRKYNGNVYFFLYLDVLTNPFMRHAQVHNCSRRSCVINMRISLELTENFLIVEA